MYSFYYKILRCVTLRLPICNIYSRVYHVWELLYTRQNINSIYTYLYNDVGILCFCVLCMDDVPSMNFYFTSPFIGVSPYMEFCMLSSVAYLNTTTLI